MSADLASALARAEVVHDRQSIERAIAAMAVRIRNDMAGSVPVFLTVMHGGLPFAGQLAMELGARGLDLAFDYLHATRYRGATSGGELHWKHRPATPLRGRRVLLVRSGLEPRTFRTLNSERRTEHEHELRTEHSEA